MRYSLPDGVCLYTSKTMLFNSICELKVLGHRNKISCELCEQTLHFAQVISRALNGDLRFETKNLNLLTAIEACEHCDY